tara:strand:- start:11538 stop:13472 length:1935 start_codon:yes stop_codon:yes gene_type:complete
MKALFSALFFSLSIMTYAQDCTHVYVEVSPGAQDNEIGWNIAQSNGWAILSGAVGETSACIQDGCLTFTMYDGGGDGWAGSIITIFSDAAVLFSGTLNDGNYEVNDLQIGNSVPCDAHGCIDAWGNYHENGSLWNDVACTDCYCDDGQITCTSIDCEIPDCEAPNYFQDLDGECCPLCIQVTSVGCADQTASNFDASSTEDDGSCQWLDCDGGLSYTSLNILIEDSICHSNLYCEDYNWDGGDCVFDCNNDLITIWDIDSYFYNGQCDQILNCMAYNFDNESCLEPQGCEDENGVSYDHGVQWSTDPCTLCSCDNGVIACATEVCEYVVCEAPNYLQDIQGQCCPVCIEVQPETDCTVQNIPIELNVGWGMFGYTCLEPQNVTDAFSSITADIIILKDYLGNAYLPEWDFNGIGSLEFASGYQIKMYQTVEGFQFCPTPSVNQVSGQEQIEELQLQLDEALVMISSLEQEITDDPIQIGDIFAGGIVFQINENGSGLVAAINDLTDGATDPYGFGWIGYEWGCFGENTDGANGTSILTGYQNTLDIATQCSTENGGTTSAHEALAYESQSYNDWYLPSKEELVEMYMTIGQGSSNGNIGGFINEFYWSSSENDDFKSWGVNFGYGFTFNTDKNLTARVRVIRAF